MRREAFLREAGPARAVLAPHPFRPALAEPFEIAPGETLTALLDRAVLLGRLDQAQQSLGGLAVLVNGVEIAPEWWCRVRPREGAIVTIRARLQGGRSGNKILRTILTLAVVFATAWIGGGGLAFLGKAFEAGAWGASLAAAGVSLLGNMLVNALAPVPQQRREQTSPNYDVSAARNVARPGAPVPLVLGRRRVVPPLAARYYRTVENDEIYLHCLFALNAGTCTVSEIKIGQTPVAEFQGVTVETRLAQEAYALSIYPKVRIEEDLSVDLAAGQATRAAAPESVRIGVDLAWPAGLYRDDNGTARTVQQDIQIHYRVQGDIIWIPAPVSASPHMSAAGNLRLVLAKREAVRRRAEWEVPKGLYEIQVSRIQAASTDARVADKCFLAAIFGEGEQKPVLNDLVAVAALKIKASGQLNGVVDEFNCVVEPVYTLPVSGAWTGTGPSTNPAVILRHLASGPQVSPARRASAARRDDEGLALFAAWCAAESLTLEDVIDSETSLKVALQGAASAGFGTALWLNGRLSVSVDAPQPVAGVSAASTIRNARGRIAFVDEVHALRVQFNNREKGYLPDERVVYADGYTAANASRYENYELPGKTDPAEVYRFGRRKLMHGLYRRESFSFEQDLEFLTVRHGMRWAAEHFALHNEAASARIVTVTATGAPPSVTVTGCVLDEAVIFRPGVSYGLRVRRVDDGSTEVFALSNPAVAAPVETRAVVLATPVPLAASFEEGDLAIWGELGADVFDGIVIGIDPANDDSATITLARYDARCYDPDTEAAPAFASPLRETPRLIMLDNPTAPEIPISSDSNAVGGVPASEVLAGITAAVSDNVLTPGEKVTLVPVIKVALSAVSLLVARAAELGVSSSAYSTANTTLVNYLATLTSPVAWDSQAGNTNVTGATLLANLRSLLEAQEALQSAMDGASDDFAFETAMGTNIATNPEFRGGSDAGWQIYNNAGGSKVTFAVVADPNAPNGSGYVARISYDGTGTPWSDPQPGFGGAQNPILDALTYYGDAGTRPGFYSRGSTIFWVIRAKIPVGRALTFATNPFGDGGTFNWLTPMDGTGNWATYVGKMVIGNSTGSFFPLGFVYISGGPNTAFTWDIAKWDFIDISAARMNFMGRGGLLDETGVPRFRNDLVTTFGTAAGIAGQTDWATWTGRTTSDVNGRLSFLQSDGSMRLGSGNGLLNTAGSAWLTDANTITALGTAAAIAGQAAAATDPTIQAGATRDVTADTRSDNFAPSHYRLSWTGRLREEFKERTALGLPVDAAGPYGNLRTMTPWGDASGGPITQSFRDGSGKEFVRYSTGASGSETWGDWKPVYSGNRLPYFGEDILEGAGGVIATRANFRTDQGTAAGIAGQGALATQNNAAWGSQITGRPAPIVDLDGGTHIYADYIRSGGVQLNNRWPSENGANVTENRTAAAISGQTSWATYSGLVPSTVAGQVQRLQTDGYMPDTGVIRQGVGFLGSFWPQEAGANVTESRTAAAIAGQGLLALRNTVAASHIDAGAVTSSKLLVSGVGTALNDDPNTQDLSAWDGNGLSIVTDSTSPVGSTVLRCDTYSGVFTRRMPVDPNRNYEYRIWVRQGTGSTTTYLTVWFSDVNDAVLSGVGIEGWPSHGTFHYFGIMGTALPGGWTEYRITFGPNETAKIPSTAKFIRVGALANYTGTGTQLLTGIRLSLKAEGKGLSLFEPQAGTYDIVDNAIRKKPNGASAWDYSVYSRDGFRGSAFVAATLDSINTFIGLSDGRENGNYGYLEFSWHRSGDNSVSIYESGGYVANFGVVASTVALSIVYDGINVRYYIDGMLQRTVATTAERTFYAGASCFSPSLGPLQITGIQFGPASNLRTYRDDGATVMPQAEIRTVEGTAAAIAGQADWATYTGLSTGTVATRVSRINSSGYGLIGTGGFLADETNTYWLTNANTVTSLGTAAGISGQAPAATDNTIETGATLNRITPRARATAGSAVTNASNTTWVTVVSATLSGSTAPLSGGYFEVSYSASLSGNSTLDRDADPGFQGRADVDYRLVSTDLSDGDVRVLQGPLSVQIAMTVAGWSAPEHVQLAAENSDFTNTAAAGGRKIALQIKCSDSDTVNSQAGGGASLVARYIR